MFHYHYYKCYEVRYCFVLWTSTPHPPTNSLKQAAFVWECEMGGGRWESLCPADQLTVEAERRAGKSTAAITTNTGERVHLDLGAGTARFALTGRTARLRKAAASTSAASSSASASSSSSSSLSLTATTVSSSPTSRPAAAAAGIVCEVCGDACESAPSILPRCGHWATCSDCLSGHVKARASEHPGAWPPCPAVGCDSPLPEQLVMSASWPFAIGFLSRLLVRYPP